MCRHLAYLGPPVRIGELCFDAPHSLRRQAQHPRLQVYGDDNPHGWAVGWWADATLHDYRTTTPMWEDDVFDGHDRAAAWMAAARYASPGSRLDVRSAAPLLAEGWMCSLNGMVERFYDGVGDDLRARCSPGRRARLVTDVDTEVCFAVLLDRFADGESPAAALGALVAELERAGSERLNFLLTDGRCIIATAAGNSLFVRTDPLVVASEPLDDDDSWLRVADRTLLIADRDGIETTSLEVAA